MHIEMKDLKSERGTTIIGNAVYIDGQIAHERDIPATEAWRAMESVAWCVKMPENWRDDLLKHDRLNTYNEVQKHGPLCRFLWIVRPNGTHLCAPGWKSNYDKIEYHMKHTPKALVYHWDGKELYAVSWGEALIIATMLAHSA